METQYIKSEKIWRSPSPEINFTSLGQAIFSKLSESDPNRVLEVNHENRCQLTVGDVKSQTIRVAQSLVRLGVKKGDTIILYSRSNTKVTPITFACYSIGAPLNFFDVSFEVDVISHNLELLDPTVIIFEEEFRNQLYSSLDCLNLPKLKHVLSIDCEDLFQSTSEEEYFQPHDIEDPATHPAALFFTSGSTGMPKIVMLSHALMIQGLYNKWWPLEPESIICSYCDLRWVVQVEMMMQPLFFGGKRIYISRPEKAIGVEEKRQIIDYHKVTHFCEVPMFYLELLASAEQSKDSPTLTSLKIALVAGEVVTDTLVDYSAKILPQCRVIKCYGMTEVSGAVATNEHSGRQSLNGGVLKNGFMVKIIDDDGLSLGPNESGRLCLKSYIPLLGYLKNDKANMKAFLEGGWYDTGDCASMDTENLLNVGTRYHELVRSAGTILIPSVVENAINNHPLVLSSALVGHQSLSNPKDTSGTLFVVLGNNQHTIFIEKELKELLRKDLTMKQLEIVRYIRVIHEIPLKSCGKADRNALKVLAIELQKRSFENMTMG